MKNYKYIMPILAFIIPLLLCLLIYKENKRFFYIDDGAALFAPVYYNIAKSLKAGNIPLMTNDLIAGNNYLIEYQFGILNPISLCGIYIFSLFTDHSLGFAVLGGLLAGFTALSAFFCLRAIGLIPALSVLGAIVIGMQSHNLIWNLAAWWPAAFGYLYFIILLTATLSFINKPGYIRGGVVIVAAYLVVTGGWPLSLLASLICTIVLLGWTCLRNTNRIKDILTATSLTCCLVLGVVTGSIAIIPTLLASDLVSRPLSFWSNESAFLVPSLKSILAFFLPFYIDFFNSWGGFRIQPAAHFYVAWFLLPVIFMIRYTMIRKNSLSIVFLICLVFSALLTQGPESFGPLRFPIRWVIYFQFFLVLSVAALYVAGGVSGRLSKLKLTFFLSILLAYTIFGVQNAPQYALKTILSALIVTGFSLVLFQTIKLSKNKTSYILMLSMTIVITALLFSGSRHAFYSIPDASLEHTEGKATTHPHGRGVDWGLPKKIIRDNYTHLRERGGYVLFVGGYSQLRPEAYHKYLPSSMGLLADLKTCNGYTSLGHTGLSKLLPFDDHGHVFDVKKIVSSLLTIDDMTSKTYAELLNITSIVASDSNICDQLTNLMPEKWEKRYQSNTFIWMSPYTAPSHTLSYISSNIKANVKQSSTYVEKIDIESPSGGLLVFSRPFWPGYTAKVDSRDVKLYPHKDALVSAIIPPNTNGVFTLTYNTPGKNIYIASIVLSTLFLIPLFRYCMISINNF